MRGLTSDLLSLTALADPDGYGWVPAFDLDLDSPQLVLGHRTFSTRLRAPGLRVESGLVGLWLDMVSLGLCPSPLGLASRNGH